MARQTLPLLTQVFVSPESKHFAGQNAFIIDIADDDDYTYCVAPSPTTLEVSKCEWVRYNHVSLFHDHSRPFYKGERVVVEDSVNWSIPKGVGYVVEPDSDGRVGISYDRGGPVVDLVDRTLVRHIL